jgi:hypothetical protein
VCRVEFILEDRQYLLFGDLREAITSKHTVVSFRFVPLFFTLWELVPAFYSFGSFISYRNHFLFRSTIHKKIGSNKVEWNWIEVLDEMFATLYGVCGVLCPNSLLTLYIVTIVTMFMPFYLLFKMPVKEELRYSQWDT